MGNELIDQAEILAGIEVSPEVVKAMNAMASREIPPDMIESHAGKGGTVKYISHVTLTRTLMNLPIRWNYMVSSPMVHADGSATVLCTLEVEVPNVDGVIRKVITEVGAFEGAPSMSHANKLAAASSRGLARCCMRMFGWGLSLYKHETPPETPDSNWSILWDYAKRHKVSNQQEVIEVLKGAGLRKADLVTRWEEAYDLIAAWVARRDVEKAPDELG